MPIGPQLPAHLQTKRKRDGDEAEDEGSASDSSSAPSLSGPQAPPSPVTDSKRRRVLGPAPPPAPLDERPPEFPAPHSKQEENNEDESSDDDDGFGPSLPSAGDEQASGRFPHAGDRFDDDEARGSRKVERDEWMMMPPKQDDLAARMDPTRIRARGFNTGKGPRGPSQRGGGGDLSTWTETPEQKRKRLENEVLGISKPDKVSANSAQDAKRKAEDEEKERKIREYNEKYRNKSLYDQHQTSTKKEEEDDPSKRAFDYEKDMAAGSRITQAQKRDMLNKAADFGSRFSKGSYL